MLIFFKGMLFIATTALLVNILSTSIVGWRRLSSPEKNKDTKVHKAKAERTFWLAIAVIIIAELMVRLFGGNRERSTLFFMHLAFSVLFFVLLLVLRFVVTGKKEPVLHFVLAIFCTTSYVFSYVLGTVMLFKF